MVKSEITLMDFNTCMPVKIKVKDIQGVKEGTSNLDGRAYPYTLVIFGSKQNEKTVKVTESAKEIGRKIIEAIRIPQ